MKIKGGDITNDILECACFQVSPTSIDKSDIPRDFNNLDRLRCTQNPVPNKRQTTTTSSQEIGSVSDMSDLLAPC